MKKYCEKKKLNTIKNMVMCIKFLFVFALLSIFCAKCTRSPNPQVLHLNKELSFIENIELAYDSILIQLDTSNDSITKFRGDRYYTSTLYNMSDEVMQIRYLYEDLFPDMFLGIDTILMFSNKKDTIFDFIFPLNYIGVEIVYSLTNSRYTIKKAGNEYMTIIRSLIDTTYSDVWYYDKNYRFTKYIHTWRNDVCVYTPVQN